MVLGMEQVLRSVSESGDVTVACSRRRSGDAIASVYDDWSSLCLRHSQ